MNCSCDVDPIAFAVSSSLRAYAPEEADAAAICPHCLRVEPATSGAGDPDFSRVSVSFPSGDAGIALALAIGLCDSLATNRTKLEGALEAVERHGADPLLAIDRVLAEPSVEPAVDLERRRHQLEQLLY
ncbi:DUF6276 family protein [Natronosalvus caseinilyticus]|uniref:DUF6276 family protein n=1 Tax=Natronosalvus caseinilyticus TaxID=2953747 RepID=UPI0028A973F1|nr:DUF6276 family protein [Natronosalvus caseinilyticus]